MKKKLRKLRMREDEGYHVTTVRCGIWAAVQTKTHSPRGESERAIASRRARTRVGWGPPLSVGPAGRALRLRSFSASLPAGTLAGAGALPTCRQTGPPLADKLPRERSGAAGGTPNFRTAEYARVPFGQARQPEEGREIPHARRTT